MLLGITLTILLSKVLQFSLVYLKETKLARFASPLVFLYVILALVITAYPAYTSMNMQLSNTITSEEVKALEHLRDTLPEDAVIIAPVTYGHYISSIAQRKNVIDDYFLMQPRINERFEDIERLYKTSLETEAVNLFNKYHATHLVVPPGVPDIKFSGSHCFTRILAQNIRVYEKDPECEVRVVG